MKILSIGYSYVVVCALVFAAAPAMAQQKAPASTIKFAVVNFQKIFREADATRSIAPQIDKLKKSYEVQFKEFQKKLQTAERDLQNQRAILSPEAYAEKQNAFKNQVNGVQRNVQSVQRMVGRVEGEAYKKVRQEFHLITQEIAKERSLDLIFPRSGLIHVDSRYDISDEILTRLNKRLPSVTVKMPSAGEGGAGSTSSKKK